jgi:cytochrome b561
MLSRFITKRYMTANAVKDLPTVYPFGIQFLHWTMGGSMIAAVGLVLAAQNTQDKKQKGDLMFYHKSFGLAAFGLLFPRLLLRATSKLPGGVPGASTLEHTAAALSHYALYGFIVFLPVSGVVMGLYGGNGLPFFYKTFPAFEQKNKELAGAAYKYHKLAGQALEYFVPLHIGGAFWHSVRGHSIFARIVGTGTKV